MKYRWTFDVEFYCQIDGESTKMCPFGLKKLIKGKRCYDQNIVHTLGYQIDILLFGAINNFQLTKTMGPPHWFKSFN